MSYARKLDYPIADTPVPLSLVPPAPTLYQRWVKRMLDVAIASMVLLVALPVMLLAALAVRVTLGRGVVYRQRRVGYHGYDFEMMKFRTMKHCRRSQQREWSGPERRQTHKSSDDPRHTTAGRVLRKTSLDELPQLIHVLRGEMSLVGPRPELSTVVDRYCLRNHVRHSVRPGLTGPWQTEHRGTGKMLHECFDVDVDYVHNVTFRRDMRYLVQTVRVLTTGS